MCNNMSICQKYSHPNLEDTGSIAPLLPASLLMFCIPKSRGRVHVVGVTPSEDGGKRREYVKDDYEQRPPRAEVRN